MSAGTSRPVSRESSRMASSWDMPLPKSVDIWSSWRSSQPFGKLMPAAAAVSSGSRCTRAPPVVPGDLGQLRRASVDGHRELEAVAGEAQRGGTALEARQGLGERVVPGRGAAGSGRGHRASCSTSWTDWPPLERPAVEQAAQLLGQHPTGLGRGVGVDDTGVADRLGPLLVRRVVGQRALVGRCDDLVGDLLRLRQHRPAVVDDEAESPAPRVVAAVERR